MFEKVDFEALSRRLRKDKVFLVNLALVVVCFILSFWFGFYAEFAVAGYLGFMLGRGFKLSKPFVSFILLFWWLLPVVLDPLIWPLFYPAAMFYPYDVMFWLSLIGNTITTICFSLGILLGRHFYPKELL